MTLSCEAKNAIPTRAIYVDAKNRREFVQRNDLDQKTVTLLSSALHGAAHETAANDCIEPREKTIAVSPSSMEFTALLDELRRLRNELRVLVDGLKKPSKRNRPRPPDPAAATLVTNEWEGKQLLDLHAVERLTGSKRSTIYARAAEKTFPQPVKLSPKASRWIASEVMAWLDARTAERNAQESVTNASASHSTKAQASVVQRGAPFSNGIENIGLHKPACLSMGVIDQP